MFLIQLLKLLRFSSTENKVGEYNFGGGVMGIHSKPEKDREELHIKGPLKQGLTLYVSYHKTVSPSPPKWDPDMFSSAQVTKATASSGTVI